MVAIRTGNATPEKRAAREVLSLREPLVESLLVGLGYNGNDLDNLRRFCKRIVKDRNAWDIARRGGLFSPRPLSRAEAERVWSQAFSPSNGEAAR